MLKKYQQIRPACRQKVIKLQDFEYYVGSFLCPPALGLTDFFRVAPPRPATPEKFTIPHRCARFGPGGHLVQVLPNLPSAGQPALVDIHSMEVLLKKIVFQYLNVGSFGPLRFFFMKT